MEPKYEKMYHCEIGDTHRAGVLSDIDDLCAEVRSVHHRIIARGPPFTSSTNELGLASSGRFLEPKYEIIGHRQAGGMHPQNTNVI